MLFRREALPPSWIGTMSKSFMLKSLRLPILNLSLSECYSLCEISYRVIFTQFLQLFLLLPSAFASANHQAGSPGDDNLGNKVLKKFKEYGMGTWTDEHFVKVQDRSPNPKQSYFQRWCCGFGRIPLLQCFWNSNGNLQNDDKYILFFCFCLVLIWWYFC